MTIPGWFVNRSVRAEIMVLSPKEIRKAVLAHTAHALSPKIQRAAHQLEQKCRLAVGV